MLGHVPGIDPTKIQRPIGDNCPASSPEDAAFSQGRIVFSGAAILPGGLPIAVIPVGAGKRAVGVVYADRTSQPPVPLNSQERTALLLLTDLLDKSLQKVTQN
jgi:hypothetical protein